MSQQRLSYRFPKSRSKSFRDVLEYAEAMPGFRIDGDEYWIELAHDATPTAELRELERLSRKWKGSAHFIGDERVTWETWWEALNPFGTKVSANTTEDWLATKAWLKWGVPENLVVGESHGNRQAMLRDLVDVDPTIPALCPVSVLFSRDHANKADKNAVKAEVKGLHIGFLPADRASRIGPAMDRFGVSAMRVAGVISGSDLLGVHIWPDRRLSAGVAIGDTTRVEPARFHDSPAAAHSAYEAARLSRSASSNPAYNPTTGSLSVRSSGMVLGPAAKSPPAPPQIRYDNPPIAQTNNENKEWTGLFLGCGSISLLIALPFLLKDGLNSAPGLALLFCGSPFLLLGLPYFFLEDGSGGR